MPKKFTKQKELQQKLKDYSKVLKNDHDWDYAYILKLLKYKLERTRKCITSNNFVRSAPKIGRQIKQVEELLERVIKDRYFDSLSKDFRKKYGSLKMITGKTAKDIKAVPITFRYTRETPKNSKIIRKESIKLHRKAEQMLHRDLKKAFALMSKNIWSWWD